MINNVLLKAYLYYKYGVHLHKPIFMVRLLKTYLKAYILKKISLKYIDFALDYRCNLNCAHCFDMSLIKPSGVQKMKVDDYRRVAREAMDLGVIDFSFQGGEIFLIPEYEEIIKVFHPEKNLISVTTNGTLLTLERIKGLKKIGVDHLNISIDSMFPQEHDAFRGAPGVHQKAMNALKMAVDNGMNVTINATVSHQTIRTDGFLKMLEFAHKHRIFINTIFAVPAGNWQGNIDVLLTREDVEYYNSIKAQNPFINRDLDMNVRYYGCGCAKQVLYITPYGDVIPCPFIYISFGNVLRESLKKIRERMLRVDYFNHYHPVCLAAEDRDFIGNVLSKTFIRTMLPIDYSEIDEIAKKVNGDERNI